jgi:hypothetical protein
MQGIKRAPGYIPAKVENVRHKQTFSNSTANPSGDAALAKLMEPVWQFDEYSGQSS